MINLERYGNTSTASIPIATCEAVQQGRLNPGDKVVFVGFGAGLTWGAAVVEWSGTIPTQSQDPPRAGASIRPGALFPAPLLAPHRRLDLGTLNLKYPMIIRRVDKRSAFHSPVI